MSQNEIEQIETQHPLLIYINRLQRQLLYVTTILHNNSECRSWEVKKPMLGILSNLPPESENVLKTEKELLLSNRTLSFNELNEIYRKIHNYAYNTLFREAFSAIKEKDWEKLEKTEEEEDES